MTTFFISESVTAGHPDKVCDQIADAILDALLENDPHSHVACEVTAIPNGIHIFGEITSAARVDYAAIARQVVRDMTFVCLRKRTLFLIQSQTDTGVST